MLARFHAGFSDGTVACALTGAVMVAVHAPVTAHLPVVAVAVAVVVPMAVCVASCLTPGPTATRSALRPETQFP